MKITQKGTNITRKNEIMVIYPYPRIEEKGIIIIARKCKLPLKILKNPTGVTTSYSFRTKSSP